MILSTGSGPGSRRFKSFRPDHFSRFNMSHRVCCRWSRMEIGYNIGVFRRKFKTQADLFCYFLSILNVFAQPGVLSVTVSSA
jgi:hypothetical protein